MRISPQLHGLLPMLRCSFGSVVKRVFLKNDKYTGATGQRSSAYMPTSMLYNILRCGYHWQKSGPCDQSDWGSDKETPGERLDLWNMSALLLKYIFKIQNNDTMWQKKWNGNHGDCWSAFLISKASHINSYTDLFWLICHLNIKYSISPHLRIITIIHKSV